MPARPGRGEREVARAVDAQVERRVRAGAAVADQHRSPEPLALEAAEGDVQPAAIDPGDRRLAEVRGGDSHVRGRARLAVVHPDRRLRLPVHEPRHVHVRVPPAPLQVRDCPGPVPREVEAAEREHRRARPVDRPGRRRRGARRNRDAGGGHRPPGAAQGPGRSYCWVAWNHLLSTAAAGFGCPW